MTMAEEEEEEEGDASTSERGGQRRQRRRRWWRRREGKGKEGKASALQRRMDAQAKRKRRRRREEEAGEERKGETPSWPEEVEGDRPSAAVSADPLTPPPPLRLRRRCGETAHRGGEGERRGEGGGNRDRGGECGIAQWRQGRRRGAGGQRPQRCIPHRRRHRLHRWHQMSSGHHRERERRPDSASEWM